MAILTNYLSKLADSSLMKLLRKRNSVERTVEDTAVGHHAETVADVDEMLIQERHLDRLPVIDVREVRYGGVSIDVDRRPVVDPAFLWKETREGFGVTPKDAKLEVQVEKSYVSPYANGWTLEDSAKRGLVGNGEDMARSVAVYTQKHVFGDGPRTIEEVRLAAEHVHRLMMDHGGRHYINQAARESLQTLHSMLGEYVNYLIGDDQRDFRTVYVEGLAAKRLDDMERVKRRVRKMENRKPGKNYNFKSDDEFGEAFDSLTVNFKSADNRPGNAYTVNFNNSNGMYADENKSGRVYWNALDNMLGEGPGSNVDSRRLVSSSIRRGLRSSGYYTQHAA